MRAAWGAPTVVVPRRSEEHTSELQSRPHLVCRLLLEKKKHVSGNGNNPALQFTNPRALHHGFNNILPTVGYIHVAHLFIYLLLRFPFLLHPSILTKRG